MLTSRFLRRSMRQTMLILSGVLLALLWAGIWHFDNRERATTLRSVAQDTSNLALAFEENVIRAIKEVDKVLTFLRHSHQRLGAGTARDANWSELLADTFAITDMTLQISVIDDYGELIANSLSKGRPQRMNLADREHFRVHMFGQRDSIFISKPVLGRVSKQWTVQLTRSFRKPDGTFGGVLVASLDPKHFSRFYESIELGENSAIMLVGSDGVVRAAGGSHAPDLGHDYTTSALMEKMRADLDGHLVMPLPGDKENSIISFRRVNGFPLHVVVAASERAAMSQSNLHRWFAMALATALSCLVGLAVVLSHRHTTRMERARSLLTQSEHKARGKARELELTLENMNQGILMVDGEGRIVVLNGRATELLGVPEDFLAEHRDYNSLVAYLEACGEFSGNGHAVAPKVLEYIKQSTVRQPLPVYERTRPNGTVIEVRSEQLKDGGFVRTFTDVTSRRQYERRIGYLARHDSLTDLANRTLFREELEIAMKAVPQGETFAVHYLDLDRFKAVNDSFGHAVGDKLLQHVAAHLRRTVRRYDLVARLGGDEFAIIQMGVHTREQASALAKRISEALCQPVDIDGNRIVCGTSVGIALAPEHGTNPDELMRLADMALYTAKADGRGTWRFFETSMREAIEERRRIELDLKQALMNSEFELHYQPLYALKTGVIVGCEALIRWRKPGIGLVPPLDFIPIAEEIGMIVPIGAWAIEEACREALHWPGDLKVAVNLSPQQFKNNNIVATVSDILQRTGLPAERLELEITESTLLEDVASTQALLLELRGLGVHIAMDDFGTGYSSLSYLHSFAFDRIKIDRAFVGKVDVASNDTAIVRSIIDMAQSLGLATTAEGIETEPQMVRLRELGCSEAQGYYFSKPQTVANLRNYLERATARVAA